jgi:phosphoribosyl isomerase A
MTVTLMPKSATSSEALADPLERPLRCVVHPDVRERRDAADRRHLQDVAGTLFTQERQRRLRHPQRAEQVGLDLVAGLSLAELLDHAELSVPGVVHDDVEAAEPIVRLLNCVEHRTAVSDVEPQRQQGVAEALGQIVEAGGVPRGGGDPVAALERRDRPLPTETARRTRDEPRLGSHAATLGRACGPQPCPSVARVAGTGFVLLPAVDVADGTAVRLVQGEAGSETSYGSPLDAAVQWQADGAEWLHLVDLDAAFGRGNNAALIAEVVERLDIDVELSGGIRDDASLTAALATGCRRVNIGTAALESPDWVRTAISSYGDRVAIGLDVRGTTLSARGWTQDGGELFETIARLDADGCARYVVTDVRRDGTLTGPNLDLLRDVCAATDRPVVASGGVSSLEDLRALAGLSGLGVEGSIVGKALYARAFTLPEALAAVADGG